MTPELGDGVEKWLVAHRDAEPHTAEWISMLDDLIDDYREHARLGVALDVNVYGEPGERVVLQESLE